MPRPKHSSWFQVIFENQYSSDTLAMESGRWAQGLKISPLQLSQWKEALPFGQNLLLWALDQTWIKESDYLEWAKEEFGLDYTIAKQLSAGLFFYTGSGTYAPDGQTTQFTFFAPDKTIASLTVTLSI